MSLNLDNAHSGTLNLSYAGVTCVASNKTTTTSGASVVAVEGRLYTLAAATGATTPVVDITTGAAFTALAASQACLLVFGVDVSTPASPALGLAQGAVVAAVVGSELPWPILPKTFCPIAYVQVKTGSTLSGTWTPGTSNWTGVTGETTGTPVNIFSVPPRPVFLA